MIDNKIIEMINSELQSIVDVPVITNENKTFKPTARQIYCRTTYLPSEAVQLTIGYDRTIRWNGIFQIDVFHPAGTGSESDNVENILKHFDTNRFIIGTDVQVNIIMPWRGTATTETDWYRVPCFLRYEAYKITP